ncbi:hypothetical protein POJ06DRAFT_9060 [Lipomyces tetrasporus]|uniref:NTF2-domain-containing protein n=1 Tax=Lipomyces tetrasporus TaxID=54092 RepID=A0AAD7QYT0_9ASCO|nr:uncharacterized protein POJ06DRAFT_9060 [Lipomyces tetrasporus]KAJ8103891.1 hypothetical protein POJ06DRAFT_9060 [Lipomyces tetrasporus]
MSGTIVDKVETNGATAPEATEKEPDAISQEEVGWLFVQSYYTYMNKEPHRLHQFYTRKSIMVHGNEGERVSALVGQQQINKKIVELGFQDCKVLVSNVDSQPSSNGGLVIQVLGEMSNRGVPSQKFVQTFFLAEQKSGYFVLNDIFRFLKEDIGSEYDEEELPIEEPATAASNEDYDESLTEPQPSHPREASPGRSADTPGPESVEQDEATIQENFASHSGDSESSPGIIIAEEVKPAVEVPPEQSEIDEVPPVALAPLPEAEPEPQPEIAPAPAAPSGPVSWAALAAKRGAAMAAAAPAAPAPAPVAAPEPIKPTPAPVPKPAEEKKKPEYHSAYIKGINDKVNDKALRDALSQFGPLKHFEVNRQKSCAFIDYADAPTLKTALEAHIVIVGEQTIYIEERRRGGNFGGNRANGDRSARNAQGGRADGDRRKSTTANTANGQTENRNRNRNANGGKRSNAAAAGKQ